MKSLQDLQFLNEDWDVDIDAFNPHVPEIETEIGLYNHGFGWEFERGRVFFSWKEILELSVAILSSRTTRLFVNCLHIGDVVQQKYDIKDITTEKCAEKSLSVGLRMNVTCEEWHSATDISINEKFMFRGKDESCPISPSWLLWCKFACRVLASPNTQLCCPQLYVPGLLEQIENFK